MGRQNLVIIDTGCANLTSVRMAFERLGVQPRVSCKAADIEQADKLILPGVGTAIAAMKNLNERELVPLIRAAKQPLLGFCLGMQMLA
ncbi:glutamine amidotransferase-related protein, partial [Aeromonas caviae]